MRVLILSLMSRRSCMREHMRFFVVFLSMLFCFVTVAAQPTMFTYQGRLDTGAVAANGTYDMQFALYGSADEGGPGNPVVTKNGVQVVNGIFAVDLDFGGPPFTTSLVRWMEIRVKLPADPSFTVLAPRQQIKSSPYSLHSERANGANSLTSDCDECVTNAHMQSVAATKITGTLSDIQLPSTILRTTGGTMTGGITLNTGGGTDSILTEDMLARNSASLETFTFRNFSPGAFQLRVDNTASAATPTYSFTGDTDTGMFGSSNDTLDFATGGQTRFQVNNAGVRTFAGGSLAAPAYSFVSDPTTGMSNTFPGLIDFSTGGQHAFQINNQQSSVMGDLKIFGTSLIVGNISSSFELRREAAVNAAGTAFTIRGQRAGGASNAGGDVNIVAGTSTGGAQGGRLLLDGGSADGNGPPGNVMIGAFSKDVLIGGPATNSITPFMPISGTVAKIRTESSSPFPDVANLTVLILNYPPGIGEILGLDNGVPGQCLSIVTIVTAQAPYRVIRDSGNFRLSEDWVAVNGATLLVCQIAPGIWAEMSRSLN